MKVFKVALLFLILLGACTSKKEIVSSEDTHVLTEDEYYRTFTEATKHALLGNYKNALRYYFVCMSAYPEKAAPYYQVSNIYLAANDIESAKKYAKKAVELDNENKWYLLNLGNIYQYENNVDSLIIVYKRINQLTDNPEYLYNLALFYSTKGEYDSSMVLVKELEKEIPDSRELYILKHRNYAGMNQSDSAITQLEKLIYYFPDQFENYGMLAEYLSEINQIERSKDVYKKLIEKDPYNGLANLSFGDFYTKQGDKDSAMYYYTRGLKAKDISYEDKLGILYNYMYEGDYMNPDSTFLLSLIEVLNTEYNDPRSYSLAAEYLLKTENYEGAVKNLDLAIEKGSENYIIWEQYLMLANFLGYNEKVAKHFPEAQEKFGESVNVYLYGGYSYFMLEKYDSILIYKDTALKLDFVEDDQKIQLLNLYADTYRELGQLDESDSIYEQILDIQPNNLMIRNNYSYYLSIRGKDLDRAEELSRLTIKEDPKNATYLDTYGWILYQRGEFKDALKYIDDAIKNGAYNNSEVLEHYGDVMFKLNRCGEAIEAWKEAIKFTEPEDQEKLNDKIKIHEESHCEE